MNISKEISQTQHCSEPSLAFYSTTLSLIGCLKNVWLTGQIVQLFQLWSCKSLMVWFSLANHLQLKGFLQFSGCLLKKKRSITFLDLGIMKNIQPRTSLLDMCVIL